MTDYTKNGGPAFPARPAERHAGGVIVAANEGMSLRDWFAGQALAGFLSSGKRPSVSADNNETIAQFWAREAFYMADAMLEARKDK